MAFELSRRNFIKGAATIGIGGALVGCSSKTEDVVEEEKDDAAQEEAPQQQEQQESGEAAESAPFVPDEIYAGGCRCNCLGGCFLNVHVRDGQIVRTSARDLPDTRYNRICSKGLTQVARVYSAERVQYPMRRIGEKGSGEFERITWDEAFDEITSKWQEYQAEFGPEAVSMMYDYGSFGVVSGLGLGSVTSRLQSALGASRVGADYDNGFIAFWERLGYTPAAAGNEPTDWENSKTIVCWGANMAISEPQLMHFMLEAKEKGTRYVVIDPAFNANTAKADWFVPIKAGTDGALAFGMINEVIANGWVDEEFCRAHTEAPFLVKEDGMFLRLSDTGVEIAEGDPNPEMVWDEATGSLMPADEATQAALTGITEANGMAVKNVFDIVAAEAAKYPLDKVSEITGIPVDDIKELARLYGEEGSVNTWSIYGFDHYYNSFMNYWPVWILSFLTHNCAQSGGSIGQYQSFPVNCLNIPGTLAPMDAEGNFALGVISPGRTIEKSQMNEVMDTGMLGGAPLTIKSLYISHSNPLVNAPDPADMIEWFNKIDLVVVSELVMTDTAKHADIVLPAAGWFEQIDMSNSSGSSPYFELSEKAIEPLYESKTDFEIIKTLAGKMGVGNFFDFDAEQFMTMYLDTDEARAMGLSFEVLKEKKAVRMIPEGTYISYEGGFFPRANGRAYMYDENPIANYITPGFDVEKERSVYWEPALEADENSEARKKHPFHVLSEHMRTRTHSQWWDVKYLQEWEPEPVVKINPSDAAELGIADGDTVKVYNDRGYVVLRAVLNPGLPSKTLATNRGFEAHEYIEGSIPSLMTKQYHPRIANCLFSDVAVSIEKM